MVQRPTLRERWSTRSPAPGLDDLLEMRESLNDQVREALVKKDPRAECRARVDRAFLHMLIRDLYGPTGRDAERENWWMLDDIRQARRAAERALGVRFLDRPMPPLCGAAKALEELLEELGDVG